MIGGATGISPSDVVIVDADDIFENLCFSLVGFSAPEFVLLVGAAFDPVSVSPAIFTLDKGTVFDAMAEDVALETLEALGTVFDPMSNLATLFAHC